MVVNENKILNIRFSNEEMKSAQTVDKALELMLNLMEKEDGKLIHIETDDVLDSADVEKAQEVLRIVFSHSEGNWQ